MIELEPRFEEEVRQEIRQAVRTGEINGQLIELNEYRDFAISKHKELPGTGYLLLKAIEVDGQPFYLHQNFGK